MGPWPDGVLRDGGLPADQRHPGALNSCLLRTSDSSARRFRTSCAWARTNWNAVADLFDAPTSVRIEALSRRWNSGPWPSSISGAPMIYRPGWRHWNPEGCSHSAREAVGQNVAVNPERFFMPLNRGQSSQPLPKPMQRICAP
jgi:hypothetical protein